MSYVVPVLCPRGATSSLLVVAVKNARQRGLNLCRAAVDFPVDNMKTCSQEKVQEMVRKQAALVRERRRTDDGARGGRGINSWNIDESYGRCLEFFITDVCSALFAKPPHHSLNLVFSFLAKLGLPMLSLREQDQVKDLTAVAVWCRRTDELVDGINGCCTTPEVLDRWEQRLVDLYQGRPHDMYDAALSHALSKYPIDIELFKCTIEGMRMDMTKTRYENFDELYLYMYLVAGTVTTLTVQVLGTCPESEAPLESVYDGAFALAISMQLTDFLQDIREDARMGRIYLPQDELAKAGLSEDDIYSGQVTNEWRDFMKEQIERARKYADEGKKVYGEMSWLCRLIFWATSLVSRKMLDKIEEIGYDLGKPWKSQS